MTAERKNAATEPLRRFNWLVSHTKESALGRSYSRIVTGQRQSFEQLAQEIDYRIRQRVLCLAIAGLPELVRFCLSKPNKTPVRRLHQPQKYATM